jgi:hypothetical protein
MTKFRRAGIWLATCSVLLQGCYESLPLTQTPPMSAPRVELVLNDQGRAALSDRLGTAVDKIEGQLVSQEQAGYSMLVYRVLQLNGNSAAWSGEKVTIAKEYTVGFQVRQLDTRKTWVAVGVVVGVVVAVILGVKLAGNATAAPGEVAPPGQSIRIAP